MKARTVICFLLAGPLAAAQVSLSVSTHIATIAEPIELRVVVRTDADCAGVKINVPAGAYEIIGRSARPVLEAAGVRTFEETITIAFFKTGEFTVGPLTIELLSHRDNPGHEQTEPLAIRIRSLLAGNDRDIKPLKDLLALRGDPRHLLKYAAAVMLLLLLGITGWLLLKKLKKKRLPVPAPLLPPEIELEMRVRELRQKNLPQRGEFRHFFISLSDMVKHFIERAYEFNAGDLTTAETVERLKNSEKDGEIITHMETVFRQADLVKFARQVPEKEAMAAIFQKIAVLIEKHKRRRELAQAENHAETGR